ncbi:MAG: VCBS repeat-containing protein [Gemmatimonadota bacterium]
MANFCRTAAALLALALGTGACGDSRNGLPQGGMPLFTELASSTTGVTFHNALEEDPIMNGFTYEYYYNGGGVAAGDLTGNGYPDLYFVGNRVPNRLYINHGDMRFQEVTAEAGVMGHQGWATGVTFVDIDGDGLLDIYLSYSGAYDDPDLRRNQLFINQGTADGIPRFVEEAAAWGLDDPGLTTQAAFFDSNGDGLLDVYVMNHGVAGFHSMEELLELESPHAVDRFYRNAGGHFVDVSEDVGIVQNDLGFGLGVSVGDLNNDGTQDLYIANDYSGRDFLYLGQRDGTFREVLKESVARVPFAAMGSDIADIDGDGWLDVMVLEMAMNTHYDRALSESGIDGERFANVVENEQHYQYITNTLQWNRGTDDADVPVFSEIGQVAGVHRSDWSWAALFADLTNSGHPDLIISNGTPSDMVHRDFQAFRNRRVEETFEEEGRVTHSLMTELLENLPRRMVPNQVFRNDGDLVFTPVTQEWGFERPTYSNGAVYVDLDRDGALDLVVNNLMAEASIYRNETRSGPETHFLAIRLNGTPPNTFGVGARVRLWAGGHAQTRELQLSRGYQSSVEPVLHFGLGAASRADSLAVRWPDGSMQTLRDVEADRYITIDQEGATPPAGTAPSGTRADSRYFAPLPGALAPTPSHQASIATQDLFLRSYPSARETFALAAGDLTGDGRDDLVVGGAAGDAATLYLRGADGNFRGAPLASSARQGAAVVSAGLVDVAGRGRNDLWLVYEEGIGEERRSYHHRLFLNDGTGTFTEAPAGTLPQELDVGPVVAFGDLDGTGLPAVFVGSWQPLEVAARPGSRLLRNEGGSFRDVTEEMAPELAGLDAVTDALWAPLGSQGGEDLVVVGHWMPVTVWRNGGGALIDGTAQAGLDGLTGWWESIHAVDLRGDGNLDLIAGNLGLNFPYRPTREHPFELYVGDFAEDGGLQAVPAYYEEGVLYPWLHRDDLARRIPWLPEEFPEHHPFAESSLPDIFGAEALDRADRYAVTEAATLHLVNAGNGRFTPRALPRAAQVSPVTGVVSADFTGNGFADLVVGGSLYELTPPVPRIDAGVGLLLEGDGNGGLEPVMPQVSGLLVPGRVRGLVGVSNGTSVPPDLVFGVVGEGLRYIQALSR